MLLTIGLAAAAAVVFLIGTRAAHVKFLLVGGSARKYLAFSVVLGGVLVVTHLLFPAAKGAIPLGLAIGLVLFHWGIIVGVIFSALGLLGDKSIRQLVRERRHGLAQFGVPVREIPLATFAEGFPFVVLGVLTWITLLA